MYNMWDTVGKDNTIKIALRKKLCIFCHEDERQTGTVTELLREKVSHCDVVKEEEAKLTQPSSQEFELQKKELLFPSPL